MASQKQQAPATLAMRAGSYREQRPKHGLAGHFHCLWTHSITSSARIAIVPDGYCDLVWIGGRVVIAGPDRTSAFPYMAIGADVVGARFSPGSAAEWLGLPMSEIVGQSVPLEDFWGTKAHTLGQQLSDCADNHERLRLLPAVLEKETERHTPPPDDIRHAFDIATVHSTADLTDRLLADISIGERQLRRRCHHYFGYGAKTLSRIRRFQRLLKLLRSSPSASLAEIAVAVGYSDQAHMNRDALELSSLTPLELQRQAALSSAQVP
ncbi:AraC family transcriptional regulator [Rhizobium sp. Root708]|uniref:AraC family transcriptional regulator n=1 Tax=Rhizobium sp. Root708 TaxID=1736592 RepID=UPI0007006A04|nr:helix-turn-helix domain-containing protein [Rhizobium sp. Root708]KRB60321.1 AraC family transcriptional regulator [Rhizobium sp. Root708]